MPSDRTKIDYAKSVLRRTYSVDPVSVGPLVVDKLYQIVRFATGDDFTNVGAASDARGEYFLATGGHPRCLVERL